MGLYWLSSPTPLIQCGTHSWNSQNARCAIALTHLALDSCNFPGFRVVYFVVVEWEVKTTFKSCNKSVLIRGLTSFQGIKHTLEVDYSLGHFEVA